MKNDFEIIKMDNLSSIGGRKMNRSDNFLFLFFAIRIYFCQ